MVTIIVGAQWGDEGKGKIVDALAPRQTLSLGIKAVRMQVILSYAMAAPSCCI